MNDTDNWLEEKERMLDELQQYIDHCSQLEPFPADYVGGLLSIKADARLANKDEIQEYLDFWDDIKPEWWDDEP